MVHKQQHLLEMDLARGEEAGIDFLNKAVVRLAQNHGLELPAAAVYGVMIDEGGQIDEKATKKRRRELAAQSA